MPKILITGVSTGIGRACADLFTSRGWEVIGTVRDPEKPPSTPWPDGMSLAALDLSDAGSGADLGRRILGSHGCPDVLLNNAGTLQFGPVENTDPELVERVFRINVFEQIALAMAFVPAMRERGDGVLANVTSLGGRMTFPFFASYNASKHALEGFSEGLWHELKPFGIRVKAIEPGFVETAIWGKTLPENAGDVQADPSYVPYLEAMLDFEGSITDRTPPTKAAEEVWDAVTDPSDRLRYPVAAYARPILRARRALGDQRMLGFFHKRWMGPDS